MDIDNIANIQLLRKLAKHGRMKMKKDCYSTDGYLFKFKEGMWYLCDLDENGFTIISDDGKYWCNLSFEEAERYLCKD